MRSLRACALICALSVSACSARKGDTNLAALIPHEASGWRAAGEDQIYDRETIFRYIDGAGEVYLQYAFQTVLVRELTRDGAPRITAQLFDMGTSEEAFGIFSFEREDESIGIGEDSEYAGGLLRFWKGRFLVCVSAELETPESQSAVIEIGKAIAGAISDAGERPRILAILPDEGLQRNTVRYFHTPFCLTYHYPVGDQNLLGLGESTEGLLASYRIDAGSARLVVIRYPTDDASAKALASLARGYTPPLDSDGYAQKQDGRWVGARIAGRVLLAAFDTTTRSQAEALLALAARKLEGVKWLLLTTEARRAQSSTETKPLGSFANSPVTSDTLLRSHLCDSLCPLCLRGFFSDPSRHCLEQSQRYIGGYRYLTSYVK